MELEHAAARELFERLVIHAAPVEQEAEREGRLRMLAFTNRIRELADPVTQPLDDSGLERTNGGRHPLPFRSLPFTQLCRELQQPCESIGPLEGLAPDGIQIRHFAGN